MPFRSSTAIRSPASRIRSARPLFPVSSSFTPRISLKSTLHSMVCAAQTDGKRNRPPANTSTILTAHCRNRCTVPGFEPVRPARRWRKLLITGIASHLNHVPDTTCHIGGLPGAAGTRVAYITGKSGEVALGKEASKADSNKAWIWNEAGTSVGYHVSTGQKQEHSSTHKQATDNPAASGVFFACALSHDKPY
jgi:hypothetical protein